MALLFQKVDYCCRVLYSNGVFPYILWKSLEKYPGSEKPTSYEISAIDFLELSKVEQAFSSLNLLMKWEVDIPVRAVSFLCNCTRLMSKAEQSSGIPKFSF